MILVTGASGLVGNYLCRELERTGRDFKAMVRNKELAAKFTDINPDKFVQADLLDIYSLESAVQDCNIIVHCGAIISFNPSDYHYMNKVNVEGTRNLVDMALKYQISNLIHISSISAVASHKGQKVVDESVQWPGSTKPSYYGISKHQAELEIWRGFSEGLKVNILNPSTLLGPGDWSRSSTRLFKYVWDENPFYTAGYLNYLDLRDFVSVIIRFLDDKPYNERFLINGGRISYKEFFEKIALSLGKKAPTVKAAGWMVKVAILKEWIKSKITGNPPLITSETAQRGKSDITYDLSRLKKVIDFKFRTIDESIDWTCAELQKIYI